MSRKKNEKPQKDKVSQPMLHPETVRGIVALVLFLAALVLVLAFWGLGGRGGDITSSVIHKILGKGFLLVPVSLVLASLSIFTSLHERFYAPTFIGSGLFLISIEGILHVFFPRERSGGYVGYAVGEPLLRLANFWPTLVVLVGLMVISLIVAFNIPLRLILFAKKKKEEKGEVVRAPAVHVEERPALATGNQQPVIGEAKSEESDTREPEVVNEKPEAPVAAPVFEVHGVGVREEKPAAPPAAQKSPKRLPAADYTLPPLDLLEKETGEPSSGDIKATASVIKRALATFGIEVEMGEVNVGPTVTQYTLRPASGIKLSRIMALQSDLALALAAHPIRIEAPIPGRSLVGIEIPNTAIMVVRLRNLLGEEAFRKQSPVGLALALGRDVTGSPTYGGLDRMPHLLIAGATGSGKSIFINALIVTLLYQSGPRNLRFILIDPKRVELAHYNGIPHLLTPVIIEPVKIVHALRWAVQEMERRYERLSQRGARDISSYNNRVDADERLPYIVVVIDELADIMAAYGKDVEGMIVRLAQMARAIGIHLVVSTQRPSVEVITGLIKANITTRIAFQVASQVDSRTVLDMSGAEKLLGRGDMLYLAGDAQKPRRIQSPYVSEKEVERVSDFLRKQAGEVVYEEEVVKPRTDTGSESADDFAEGDDPLYEDTKNLVIETGKASATFLQRRLKIGYARAARLLDILESKGVVGPGEGAKPREVFGAKASTYRDALDEDSDEKEGGGEEVMD